MAKLLAEQHGFWKVLGLLLTPVVMVMRFVTAGFFAVFFFLFVAIAALLAFIFKPAEPPSEVLKLVSRLAAVTPLQGSPATQSCESHQMLVGTRGEILSCTFGFGDISTRVSWRTKTGRVTSVSLTRPIRFAEQKAHQSDPLGWLDFPSIHRIFCSQNSDAEGLLEALPQRLSQARWTRWSGTETVPANPSDLNATRSVVIANVDRCNARLEETREAESVRVTLRYQPIRNL